MAQTKTVKSSAVTQPLGGNLVQKSSAVTDPAKLVQKSGGVNVAKTADALAKKTDTGMQVVKKATKGVETTKTPTTKTPAAKTGTGKTGTTTAMTPTFKYAPEKWQQYYTDLSTALQQQYGVSKPADYSTYQQYYDDLSKKLLEGTGQIEYTPESAGRIKSGLQKIMRPTYDQAIENRQEATKANRAALDADAASRGMGSSTWVSDVKNRAATQEARDIAGLNADYSSSLYSALMNKLSEQDQLSMQAQTANLGARQTALGQALSAAGQLYGSDREMLSQALGQALTGAQYFYEKDDEGSGGGGGGGGHGGGGGPRTPTASMPQPTSTTDAIGKAKQEYQKSKGSKQGTQTAGKTGSQTSPSMKVTRMAQ